MNAFQKAIEKSVDVVVEKDGSLTIMSKGDAFYKELTPLFEGSYDECLDKIWEMHKERAQKRSEADNG